MLQRFQSRNRPQHTADESGSGICKSHFQTQTAGAISVLMMQTAVNNQHKYVVQVSVQEINVSLKY